MTHMASLRKVFAQRQVGLNRALLILVWRSWRTPRASRDWAGYLPNICIVRSVLRLAQWLTLHKCRKQLRRWQKEDRETWLHDQCTQLQDLWPTSSRRFYQLVNNFQPRMPRTLPPHKLADGSLAATPATAQQLSFGARSLGRHPGNSAYLW
eukprot:4929600-Amphidinium_carterae.1